MEATYYLEILESYEDLIADCEDKILKGIDIETNKRLKKEYINVLNEFIKNRRGSGA